MEPDRLAAVLGVSSAVASQLLARGRRGLSGRFAQARRPEPEHLGAALRPLAAAVPANLADEAAARWKALVSDPSARLAPLTGWMNERAVRPLWVSVGALMGLGLIGLGIVGQSSTVNNGGVATGTLPGVSAPGVNPLAGKGLAGLAGGVGTVAPNSGLNPGFATSGGGGGSATTFGNTPGGGSVAGGGGTGTSTPPTNSVPGGGGSPNGGCTTNCGGGTVQSQGNTVVNSPVLSVTNSGGPTGTTNLNINSTQTGRLATVTLGSKCTGVSVTGVPTIGCTTQAPPPAPSPTPTSPGATSNASSNTTASSNPTTSPTSSLSTTTQTVTNTISSLTSGL
jgi:hypothetical protein